MTPAEAGICCWSANGTESTLARTSSLHSMLLGITIKNVRASCHGNSTDYPVSPRQAELARMRMASAEVWSSARSAQAQPDLCAPLALPTQPHSRHTGHELLLALDSRLQVYCMHMSHNVTDSTQGMSYCLLWTADSRCSTAKRTLVSLKPKDQLRTASATTLVILTQIMVACRTKRPLSWCAYAGSMTSRKFKML